MSTTKIMTITAIVPCEGGQCGGEVTLTTDVVENAYAVTTGGSRYTAADCEAIEKRADGTIVVSCAAIDLGAERTCDGTATFTPDVWADAAYTFSDHARLMEPMDHEEG